MLKRQSKIKAKSSRKKKKSFKDLFFFFLFGSAWLWLWLRLGFFEGGTQKKEMSMSNAEPSSLLTRKEQWLLERVTQQFIDLGPDAISLLKYLVTEDKNQESESMIPCHSTLRGLERFFQRMAHMDDEVAFYHIVKRDPSSSSSDSHIQTKDPFRSSTFSVTPCHAIASFRRMTSMYQRKYLDAFARRTEIQLFGFKTTLCQAMFIQWFIREGIIHREQYLRNQPMVSSSSSSSSPSLSSSKSNPTTTAALLKSKPVDAYLYCYPASLALPKSETEYPVWTTSDAFSMDMYRRILNEQLYVGRPEWGSFFTHHDTSPPFREWTFQNGEDVQTRTPASGWKSNKRMRLTNSKLVSNDEKIKVAAAKEYNQLWIAPTLGNLPRYLSVAFRDAPSSPYVVEPVAAVGFDELQTSSSEETLFEQNSFEQTSSSDISSLSSNTSLDDDSLRSNEAMRGSDAMRGGEAMRGGVDLPITTSLSPHNRDQQHIPSADTCHSTMEAEVNYDYDPTIVFD